MRRTVVLLALALAGCDLLFTPDEPGGGTPDATTGGYRVTLSTLYIGAVLDPVPIDVAGATGVFLYDDPGSGAPVSVPATVAAPSTWFGAVPDDAAASLRFQLPGDDVVRLWNLPTRDVTGEVGVLHHRDAELAPAGAAIQLAPVTFSPLYDDEDLSIAAVGAWTTRASAIAELPPMNAAVWSSDPFDYASFVPADGRNLWRVTTDDVVTVLRHDQAGTLVGALIWPGFDQTAEVTSIAGPIEEVIPDQLLTLTLDPAVPEGRFVGPLPAGTVLTMGWSVIAAPGGLAGSIAGPRLAAHTVGKFDIPTSEIAYGNPLPWAPIVRWSASSSRLAIASSGPEVAQLAMGLASVAAAATTVELTSVQPLPTLVTVAGVPLTADDLDVPIDRAKPVEIRFDLDLPSDAGVYEVQLIGLVPEADGYRRVLRADLLGVAPHWRIPAELLEPGTLYTLRAFVYSSGFPGAASGDLAARTLPLVASFLDSGIFHVTP